MHQPPQRGPSPLVQDIFHLGSHLPPDGFDSTINQNHNKNNNTTNNNGTLDPSLLDQSPSYIQPFDSQAFNQTSFPSSDYLAPEQVHRTGSHPGLLDPFFFQAQTQHQSSAFNPPSDQLFHHSPPLPQDQASNFGTLDQLSAPFGLDQNNPSLGLDPQFTYPQENRDQNQQFIDMATMHQQSIEAPHLLQPRARNHSVSSALSSPAFYGEPFPPPYNHSRHASLASLDPSSAAYPQQNNHQWTGPAFNGHRSYSDQHSDVSVSSAQPSPFLGHQDSFDNMGHPSPLLNGTVDLFIPDMNSFSLSDQIHQQSHISPGPSPHMSPYMNPQQMPAFANTEYTLNNNMFAMPEDQYNQEAFPTMSPPMESIEMQPQLIAPEIKVDWAPEARQTQTHQPQFINEDNDALFPPRRSSKSPRPRARSDPYVLSNQSRAGPGRGRSPSIGGLLPTTTVNSRPRSVSPAVPAGINKNGNRRASSPAFPSDRILEMAHQTSESPPSGSPSGESSHGAKRGQKHPSTFHCTLCDKSFTRAYNLRSHTRTHTDERPFVCTVCGKAFARQHDRKRHESLHSGEKRFECKGVTSQGLGWGCSRGFARADALGRHFRSEAGRACIKPLLDEEAVERQRAMQDQANLDMMNQHQNGTTPLSLNIPGPLNHNSMPLPSALLQMYPALAEIQWNSIPTIGEGGEGDGSGWEEESDNDGRNSFDASSMGEYLEDEDNVFTNGNGNGNGMGSSYNY